MKPAKRVTRNLVRKKNYACQSHCCVIHGCKYNDKDCPVVSETVMQDHICEWCSHILEDADEVIDSIQKTRALQSRIKKNALERKRQKVK